MLGPGEASGRGLSLASETLTLPLLALGASSLSSATKMLFHCCKSFFS